MRRARRIFLTTCAVIAVLALIAGGAAYTERDRIEAWLRDRAITLYLKKIEPDLPFKIESFEIRKGDWRDFLNWKIPELLLVLRRDDWRARLIGPIEINRSKSVSKASGKVTPTETRVLFKPQITVERVSRPETFGPFNSRVTLRIFITGDVRSLEDLADIREAKVSVRAAEGVKVAWPPLGLEVEEPFFRVDWVAPGGGTTGGSARFKEAEEGHVLAQVSAKAVNWADPGSSTRLASLVEPSFEAELPLEVFPGQEPPVKIGPEGAFHVHVKSGETAWDDAYVNVPWALLPINGKVRIDGFKPEKAEVSIGPERAGLDASATLSPPYLIQWRSRGAWELKDWVKELLEATSGSTGPLGKLQDLRAITFKKGRVQTRGSATLTRLADDFGVSGAANLSLTGLDLDFPEQAAAVRGLKLDVDAGTALGMKGLLEIPEIHFKRAKLKLGPVPFSLTPDARAPPKLDQVKVGGGQNLPLELPGIPFHLGTLSGTLDLRPPADAPNAGPRYELTTHLQIPPLGIERLSKPFCLPRRVPPALLSVRFPKIELSNDAIDPEGTVRVDLFGGNLTVSDVGLYDLFTEVPEVDFSAEFTGIRLDHLGNFVNLGEIGGTLEGYARDVTIQGWLPTHFDFRAEAKPYNRSVVVFSPEAMENFVKLMADDAMDQLPGVAKWFFFGFPAKLVGGYDVHYVGISAFSQDGNILLETLDPPDPVKKSQNHFILYGPRFKMPLKASRYPLIVDNAAMSNFARQKFLYMKNLAEQKRLEKEAAATKDQGETKDDSQDDCMPDVLRDRAR